VHAELVRLTASWGIDVKDLAIADIQFKDQAVADKLADATSNTRTAEAEFDLTLAEARIRLEKAQANAQEQLIVQTNGAKIKKIDAENNSQTKLIQERALAQAEALKRAQEIKTETDMIEARAAAKACELQRLTEARVKEITALAEAERTADLLRAEGQKALADAQIKKFSNPQILQLEMMKHYVEATRALASAPTPAVLLQQSGGGGGGGRHGAEGVDFDSGNVHHMPGMMGEVSSDMLDVFRTQGKFLLAAAMNKGDFKTAAEQNASPSKAHTAPAAAAASLAPPLKTKSSSRRASSSRRGSKPPAPADNNSSKPKVRRKSLEELVVSEPGNNAKPRASASTAARIPGAVN
jgi:hypothetical protein